MGISAAPLHFILKNIKKPLGKTLVLGRQEIRLAKYEKNLIKNILSSTGYSNSKILEALNEKYADKLFNCLGSSELTYMDYSDFEGADLIHDLNFPIPEKYANSFDTVIDGGTIDHVFNIPVCLFNLYKLLVPGGTLISMSPANNYAGHGFYQFSPELFYRFISAYEFTDPIAQLYIFTKKQLEIVKAKDPSGIRTELGWIGNTRQVLLMVKFYKSNSINNLIKSPLILYQSDYVSAWSQHANEN